MEYDGHSNDLVSCTERERDWLIILHTSHFFSLINELWSDAADKTQLPHSLEAIPEEGRLDGCGQTSCEEIRWQLRVHWQELLCSTGR